MGPRHRERNQHGENMNTSKGERKRDNNHSRGTHETLRELKRESSFLKSKYWEMLFSKVGIGKGFMK